MGKPINVYKMADISLSKLKKSNNDQPTRLQNHIKKEKIEKSQKTQLRSSQSFFKNSEKAPNSLKKSRENNFLKKYNDQLK